MNEKQVHNEIDELLARYLSGEIDRASFLRLKELAGETEDLRCYVRDRLEVGFSAGVAGDTTSFFNKEKGYALFRQRVADYNSEMASYQSRFPWKIIGWVAAVILVVVLPIAGFWQGQYTMSRHFAKVKVETAVGTRTNLTLPDGTTVCLNSGSRLTYPQDFGINHRHLSLEGEAYFDVKHNDKLPFEINTKEINLRVLGTRFTFSNYADDKLIIVDLEKGRVCLNDNLRHREMYLSPNERMTYNKQTGEMTKASVNVEHSPAWTKDELFFDEQPLSDIAKELMRVYHVKIVVPDRLKNKSFYGSFRISQNSVDDILQTLSSTGEIKYRYENNKYIIY